MSGLNSTAKMLRALHEPGKPLLLANVHDAITAKAVASLPNCYALATASYAVAAAAGLDDEQLDLETNLRAIEAVSRIAKQFNKPLTVDFQGGYGDKLEDGIKRLIEYGVVGINLEDTESETNKLYTITEAAARVKRAVLAASALGVPDFVVNARVDTLSRDGSIEEALERGKAYLEAGAANVFVWRESRKGGISAAQIKQLTEAFNGKLNVLVNLTPGDITIESLAAIGIARCSVGPLLAFSGAQAVAKAAQAYFDQGK